MNKRFGMFTTNQPLSSENVMFVCSIKSLSNYIDQIVM